MADKNKQQNINNKLDALSESEYRDVLQFISRLEASRPDKTIISDDELIVALQNERENRRARQVFEWEHARREKSPQAAAFWRGAA